MRTSTRSTQAQIGDELVMLRKAVETSGEVIFLTDRDGLILYVNPEFERVYGYKAEEVVLISTPRILKSGLMADAFYHQLWEILLDKGIVKGEIINRCKDGRLVPMEGSANPILDEAGEIIGFLAIQRDISARKQAEEEIIRRNKEMSALCKISASISQSLELNQILKDSIDEVLGLDFLGPDSHCILFLLDEPNRRLTLAAQRSVPENHPCLAAPPALGECLCGQVAVSGEPMIETLGNGKTHHSRIIPMIESHTDICMPLRARGRILGVMNLLIPGCSEIDQGELSFLGAVVEQISVAIENASLFEDLNQQHRHLRDLTSRLAEVEETERRRLAHELHDQVGQNLTALGVNLNILRAEFGLGRSEKFFACLEESLAMVEKTTEITRDLMAELRPPILDDYGLLATLHWYGSRFAARAGLLIDVKGEEPVPKLPSSVETALFRITQEALTNIAKHAQAQHVCISLEFDEQVLRLTIADDGVGFFPEKLNQSSADRGWGLSIMAERAESIGGSFTVESLPVYSGCRIVVEAAR